VQKYNIKYSNHFYYHWIPQSTFLKQPSYFSSNTNCRILFFPSCHTLIYIPTTCTSITDVILDWVNFVEFYELLVSSEKLKTYALEHYRDLTHFLISWSSYTKHKFIPLVGLKQTPLSVWRLGPWRIGLKWAPMHDWALQWSSQCSRGVPLTNCITTHLNVPWRQQNGIFGTTCVEQDNRPSQLITLVTPTMQKIPISQPIQTPTQQQCHLPILKIQRSIKTNRMFNATKRTKWVDRHLEDAMDIVEKGHTSLWKAAKYWNIPLTSLLNHLNYKARSRKVGPQGVLMEQEDVAIVTCILNM
jgi:hypothetical protein